MFIDEDRYGPPRGAADVEDLAEELATRVQLLKLLVVGIITVLGDQQDRIDRKCARAQRKSVGDCWAETDAMPAGHGPAEIGGGGHLLDEQACNLQRRLVQPFAVMNDKPVHESSYNVISMREIVIDGRERGDFGSLR